MKENCNRSGKQGDQHPPEIECGLRAQSDTNFIKIPVYAQLKADVAPRGAASETCAHTDHLQNMAHGGKDWERYEVHRSIGPEAAFTVKPPLDHIAEKRCGRIGGLSEKVKKQDSGRGSHESHEGEGRGSHGNHESHEGRRLVEQKAGQDTGGGVWSTLFPDEEQSNRSRPQVEGETGITETSQDPGVQRFGSPLTGTSQG